MYTSVGGVHLSKATVNVISSKRGSEPFGVAYKRHIQPLVHLYSCRNDMTTPGKTRLARQQTTLWTHTPFGAHANDLF